MTSIPEAFSVFAFIMLGLFCAPEDALEFHISLLDKDGYSDSMIARKIENGFAIYDRKGDDVRKIATVRRDGRDGLTYGWEENGESRESCDFSSINDLSLREGHPEEISFQGQTVRLTKVGEAVFVDPTAKRTLVVHW